PDTQNSALWLHHRPRLPEQDSGKHPIEPKALNTRSAVKPASEFGFDHLLPLIQLAAGVFLLIHLPLSHREDQLRGGAAGSVMLRIGQAAPAPIRRLRIISAAVFEQRQ